MGYYYSAQQLSVYSTAPADCTISLKVSMSEQNKVLTLMVSKFVILAMKN